MKVTKEYCDLCDKDITNPHGELIYRGQFHDWWHWFGKKAEDWGPITICEDCWDELRQAVRKKREGGNARTREVQEA